MPKPSSHQGGRRAASSRLGKGLQVKRAGTLVDKGSGTFPNARYIQISGGIFNVASGDVHNQYHADGSGAALWVLLQAIPNFRKIYQDMLSKATPGTGMWLLENKRFRIWLEANGDIKIFCGSGMPGAGKTVLASIVIQRLEALRQELEGPVCVCFIYFRYSDHAELTLRRVLEILLKQTLERHPDCRSLIEETYSQHLREGTEPTESQLVALLHRINEGMAVTFYVLDALDEAPPNIQLSVLRTLVSLNVKLFITSRPLKAVESAFPEAHTFEIIAQDGDIDLHIDKGIDESSGLLNLLRQEGPSLREEIMSTIKTKSDGMFLHASLQMDALSGCVTLHQVRRTLHGFPSQIADVYFRTWHRILQESPELVLLAKAVFVWVLNASRSMTIEELERAVATSPETHKFEPDRVAPRTTLIELCRGLLVVEEESQVVRLVHYTAKEHLQRLLAESFTHPHFLLANVCMTHLTECGFQNTTITCEEEFRITLKNDLLLAYASEAWSFHAQQSFAITGFRERTAVFVANSCAFPAFISPDRTSVFDILSTVHIVGLYHLPLDFIGDLGTRNPNFTTAIRRQTPLMVASLSGYESLVKLLLAHAQTKVNLVDSYGWSSLMLATQRGRTHVTALLLARPEIKVNHVSKNGRSTLMLAARYGQECIAAQLLARPEIDVNLVNIRGKSALIMAAEAGHESVARQLLARSEIELNLVDEDGWSALILAAEFGHERVAAQLLDHPEIEVNLVNKHGGSALMNAARHCFNGITSLLLTHSEIQVNAVNNLGESALMLACYHGHESIVKALLTVKNIDINLTSQDKKTAMSFALSKGHPGIVKLLQGFGMRNSIPSEPSEDDMDSDTCVYASDSDCDSSECFHWHDAEDQWEHRRFPSFDLRFPSTFLPL